eukprot:31422-Pelagococcus_subviridis.AAC.7
MKSFTRRARCRRWSCSCCALAAVLLSAVGPAKSFANMSHSCATLKIHIDGEHVNRIMSMNARSRIFVPGSSSHPMSPRRSKIMIATRIIRLTLSFRFAFKPSPRRRSVFAFITIGDVGVIAAPNIAMYADAVTCSKNTPEYNASNGSVP